MILSAYLQLKLFYLILLLLPVNLAKHFLVPSSFVAGVLVDYLIPAVYLTDVLIIILLELLLVSTKPKINQALVIFLALLLPSLLAAAAFVPAVYKWLKLLELAGFAWWIKKNISWKKHLPAISLALTGALLWQSLLAIAQWFKQGSILGYWFLGEQPYNAATAGMDKISWLNGALKLPPLGTTPHPNVLAGLIVVLLPFLLNQILYSRWYLIPVFLSLVTLFLTFSLSAWLALVLIIIPFFLYRLKPILLVGYAVLIISLIAGFFGNFEFLAPQTSFDRRSQLAGMAIKMVQDSPLIGQGLNNFTVVMDQYGIIAATTRFLQPVHNIYLLILAETGILGLFGFGYLIVCAFRSPRPAVLKLSLFTLLFLGLFDHYPFTLQQGMLLLFLLV